MNLRQVFSTFTILGVLSSLMLSNLVAEPGHVGVASWYGPGFHGRKTANGEVYNMNELTAAHRTLPLGTVVKVRNFDNGKSVVVRINDRGPYIKGREIDLSYRAAHELGMVKKGKERVEIRVIK